MILYVNKFNNVVFNTYSDIPIEIGLTPVIAAGLAPRASDACVVRPLSPARCLSASSSSLSRGLRMIMTPQPATKMLLYHVREEQKRNGDGGGG